MTRAVYDQVCNVYIATSSASILGLLGVLFLYLSSPTMRKFPSQIIFWTVVCDRWVALRWWGWGGGRQEGDPLLTTDRKHFAVGASAGLRCWAFCCSLVDVCFYLGCT